MIPRFFARAAALAVLPILATACGDDPVAPGGTTNTESTTLRTQVDSNADSFVIDTAPAPGGHGRFILRGENIHWDEDEQALLADLTVENASDDTYPEPVLLTFLELLPSGTTVKNSDNGETGPGAQIVFEFEDDDGEWTPGEVSFPRTVMFGTEEGTAVAFVARLDVGLEPGSGVVGGMVWHDENADGEIDQDEPGLGGVAVVLAQGGEVIRQTTTREDGMYGFDGLPSGVYHVHAVPTEGWVPTTAPELTVVLPETSSFLHANFGCRREGDNGGDHEIRVGDRVHAKGGYEAEPDRLVAAIIDVSRCRDRHKSWGSLRGPATDVDAEAAMVWLMGTPVVILDEWDNEDGDDCDDCDDGCPKPRLDQVEVGDRLAVDPTERVNVDDEEVLASSRDLKCWNGRDDRVKGVVQQLREGDEGLRAIRVLDTWIEITEDTVICVKGDDDDDDCDCDD